MDVDGLKDLLDRVRAGELPVEHALERLKGWPVADLGFALIDHHRALRKGFPEVVYCAGKTPDQVAAIISEIASRGMKTLATRAGLEHFEAVREVIIGAGYHPAARVITIGEPPLPTVKGEVLVLTAGTSDIPVAEEAAITARWWGSPVRTAYDVGVAGLHRLLDRIDLLRSARVIIVAAGMDGVLASVVGGLVQVPVIAVPTSVGYGAGAGGITPLLTMLNSCAPGVAVVNIDNGFGAGYLAGMINHLQAGADSPDCGE